MVKRIQMNHIPELANRGSVHIPSSMQGTESDHYAYGHSTQKINSSNIDRLLQKTIKELFKQFRKPKECNVEDSPKDHRAPLPRPSW